MTTEQNKDVVRRFMTEVLAGGQLDKLDELAGPTYVNRSFDLKLDAIRAMLAGLADALPERRFDIEELIAEGDAVVARFTGEMRDTSGTAIPFRGLTYYRLADGKIVEDDPLTSPDLGQAMGSLMPPPS